MAPKRHPIPLRGQMSFSPRQGPGRSQPDGVDHANADWPMRRARVFDRKKGDQAILEPKECPVDDSSTAAYELTCPTNVESVEKSARNSVLRFGICPWT